MTAARSAEGGRGDGARGAETTILSGEVESPLKGDLPRRGSFKMLQVEREAMDVESEMRSVTIALNGRRMAMATVL